VARQVRNRRFVQSGSRVNVDSICELFGCSKVALWVVHSVLASRREQQATVRSECEPSEKGRESVFSSINLLVSQPQSLCV
jgi:hypothetical protein